MKIITNYKLIALKTPPVGSINILKLHRGRTENTISAEVSLKTYFNQDIVTKLTLPRPTAITFSGINFDEIELECLHWAKSQKLYEGDLFKVLEKTHVALLTGVTYPNLPKEGAVLLTKWLMALFAIDDWVDEDHQNPIPSQEIKQNVTRKLDIISKLRNGSTTDQILLESDTPITKAIAHLFPEISSYITKVGGSMDDFVLSLDNYFSSIIAEKQYEETKQFPSPDFCSDLRADSSGAVHAIFAGMVIQGQAPFAIEKTFYNLLSMRKIVAKCVEYSNDILSHYKEFLKLLRSSKSDHTLALTEIHGHPQLNLIHIKWHNYLPNFPSLERAYTETIQNYNQLVEDFFIMKENLLKEIEKATNTQKSNVTKCIEVLDGWLSQIIWGMIVERYNVGGAPCTQPKIEELLSQLKKSDL